MFYNILSIPRTIIDIAHELIMQRWDAFRLTAPREKITEQI
jgi:hypothetical protein